VFKNQSQTLIIQFTLMSLNDIENEWFKFYLSLLYKYSGTKACPAASRLTLTHIQTTNRIFMSTKLKYWYLHEHKLFKNLTLSEIDALCILNRFKKSKKNEIIGLPFNEKERIYILKQGTIKLIKINDEGEEILLDIIQEGDLFGELNLEQSAESHEFIKVVSEEAIICTFFREKLEEIILKKPDFALNYIKFIGSSSKKIQNSYKNILFKDAKTRLLLLLNMIIEKENIQERTFSLPNYLTQKDIAQLICTTRQTVISLISKLEKEGILKYSQKEILILDIQKLKAIIKNVK